VPRLPVTLAASALLVLLWSRASLAAEADVDVDAGAEPRDQVALTSAPASDALASFETALADSLAARGLTLVRARKDHITSDDVVALADAPPTPGAPRVVARVWLDVAAAHELTLSMTDGARRRVFVRRMPLQHGFDAVARESVLFVVESSLEAMLAGQAIGVSREDYRRDLEATRAPAPAVVEAPAAGPAAVTPSPTIAIAGIGYGATALGAGVAAHGPHVALEYWSHRLRLGAGFHADVPVRVGDAGAGARLSTAGARLSVAARLLSHGGLALIAGGGAGYDATRVQPSVTAAELLPTATFWAGGASLRGFVELDGSVGRFVLALAAGADVHPIAERYLVNDASGTREVFVPLRVRPTATLTLGIRL